jgi:hypothetical protein
MLLNLPPQSEIFTKEKQMNTSSIPVFFFVLILIGIMAAIAFAMSKRQGQSIGNALLESGVWGGSLIACAGGDYLLVMLNSTHAWA